MDKAVIWDTLSVDARTHLVDIQVFGQIDSTNLESLRQVKSGKGGTRLIVAEAQSDGRGRLGRSWMSPAGGGIYLSLIRSFGKDNKPIQSLSLVSAISVLKVVEALGGNSLQLKWPNDLLFQGQKLAGVLLELHVGIAANDLVFGIGLNLSLSDEDKSFIDRPITDLRSILGQRPDDSIVVAKIVNVLIENILIFENQGFRPFSEIWNSYDCHINQDIVIQVGNTRKVGKSLGVDETGGLVLQMEDHRELVTGGEIFSSLGKI
ncbi:MAG: biotin--[acetyl-CoA-carboxylase] ligase [Pseudomonadota bacterium]|nr:biotin--[acetyl-CoA-carboxylase] ligase [Pseudomonadota bacterium]